MDISHGLEFSGYGGKQVYALLGQAAGFPECIYQSVAERKLVLENVMAEAKGKITVIAHIACSNTADSQELAAHAESMGGHQPFMERRITAAMGIY